MLEREREREREKGEQAKHGTPPGTSSRAESHYGGKKRKDREREREKRVEGKKWDERATNERFPCEAHKSADYEQRCSKPDSQAVDQSIAIRTHTHTHTHIFSPLPSLCIQETPVGRALSLHLCFTTSKASRDAKRQIIFWQWLHENYRKWKQRIL